MTESVLVFALGFFACLSAGSTGSLFPTGDWYKTLNKPDWTPPDWVFPIAWLYLYVALSYSLVRVYGTPGNDLFLIFWALQLVFNTLWTEFASFAEIDFLVFMIFLRNSNIL